MTPTEVTKELLGAHVQNYNSFESWLEEFREEEAMRELIEAILTKRILGKNAE